MVYEFAPLGHGRCALELAILLKLVKRGFLPESKRARDMHLRPHPEIVPSGSRRRLGLLESRPRRIALPASEIAIRHDRPFSDHTAGIFKYTHDCEAALLSIATNRAELIFSGVFLEICGHPDIGSG